MDPFLITILIIVATTLLVSYIRRVTKDKCLKSFEGFRVTITLNDQNTHTGKLEVEATGVEAIFHENQGDPKIKMSHIIYKEEYPLVLSVLRYHDQLTSLGEKKRNKALKKTYHPHFFLRLKRRIMNFFKLLKDSLMEIVTMLSGKMREASTATIMTGNEKHSNRVNQELVNTIDATYDPLLEKYIGNIVTLQYNHPDGSKVINGILKEYTQNFLEMLDMEDENGRKYDGVFPRRITFVRGLGESKERHAIFKQDYDIKGYKKYFKGLNKKKSQKIRPKE